jgi:formate dehydrogenase major subunit
MTNSYNDTRNAETILLMGGNPAEDASGFIAAHPRRQGAQPREFHRGRSEDDPNRGACDSMGCSGTFSRTAGKTRNSSSSVYGIDDIRKEVAKWTPDEVERVTGLPEAQVKHIADVFSHQKPAMLIWAMGQTQFATGTANVRASCILLLATGNVGYAGGGANIFRDHTNVQGATDLGLDVTTLPLYYGLAEEAWQHWCRVWEVDIDWMRSRFGSRP